MNIDELFWDEVNEEHISRHAVTRKEVEDVCFSKNFVRKSGRDKFAVWGQTSSGRYIMVILGARDYGSFYPITARVMGEKEKRRYRTWQKK